MYTKDLEIIKTAIINEQEGYQFYLLAAEKAVDQEVKEVFLSLAGDEKEHEGWLRTVYREILDKGQLNQMLIEFSRSPGIFSFGKLKNTGGLTVSALHVGVMMEKESIDYYQLAAADTNISELKLLLESLAKWESTHLERLEQAYEFARDDWWEQQGFSTS